MQNPDQLKTLKALALARGWEKEFWDDDEEELFDRGHDSVVAKIISLPTFAFAIYGRDWVIELGHQNGQTLLVDQLNYMYEHKGTL